MWEPENGGEEKEMNEIEWREEDGMVKELRGGWKERTGRWKTSRLANNCDPSPG